MSSDPRLVDPQRAGDHDDFDPLRLCVFATVALLGWLLGPLALVVFAGTGYLGYHRARRAGLTRSRCKLGDTRLVLGYLAVLTAVGVVAAVLTLSGTFRLGWW